MSYHQVTVYSSKLEDYVLKVHGQGWYDMYIQLPNLNALQMWEKCLNQKKPDYLVDVKHKTTTTNTLKTEDPLESLDIIQHPHDVFESNLSQDHLLTSHDDKSNNNNIIYKNCVP